MKTHKTLPVVLVPACNRQLGPHPFQIAGKKYIDFVRLAGCLPLVVPNASDEEVDVLMALADGVLLTGSPSNVHPRHFDEGVHDPKLPLDAQRDTWILPFIPKVLARGLPLMAICRGAQEVNVAMGGSLHQAVHEQAGMADHRAPAEADTQVQYGPAHAVRVVAGGVLSRTVECEQFEVNSIHAQAVNVLAQGLLAEAHAPDGLIEAFCKPDAPDFNLCVQWHPEWQAAGNPVSVRLAQAFGDACRRYRAVHRHAPA